MNDHNTPMPGQPVAPKQARDPGELEKAIELIAGQVRCLNIAIDNLECRLVPVRRPPAPAAPQSEEAVAISNSPIIGGSPVITRIRNIEERMDAVVARLRVLEKSLEV